MRASFFGVLLVVGLSWASDAAAQGGDGSLRGVVRDTQGGALPGVTVTATSPALLVPRTAVSDADGNYRLINLPPGTYTLTAELTGFSTFSREGILLRAGANFQVDIAMALGTLEETITVTGDSPMLEVSSPSNVLNIDAELPEDAAARRRQVLERLPAHDAGRDVAPAQRRQRPPELLRQRRRPPGRRRRRWKGCTASNYNDSNINRTGLSTEAVEDMRDQDGRRRCGVADGLRAGDQHDQQERRQPVPRLGRLDQFQPFAWNATTTCGNGTPATRQVNQADFSVGGPIERDRDLVLRRAAVAPNNESDTEPHSGPWSRPSRRSIPDEHARATPRSTSLQPWAKVTARLGTNHDAVGHLPGRPAALLKVVGQTTDEPDEVLSTGGAMYGAQADVGRGARASRRPSRPATTTRAANGLDSYDGRSIPGPLHRRTTRGLHGRRRAVPTGIRPARDDRRQPVVDGLRLHATTSTRRR